LLRPKRSQDLEEIDPAAILATRTRRKPPVNYTDPEVIKRAGLHPKDMEEDDD
jgi:hypothetical protein